MSTDASGADPATGEIRYLALGDSISQGIGAPDPAAGSFPALLAERWRVAGRNVVLKNLGAAHATAADLIAKQLGEIAPFRPTFITLQVGSNDLATNVAEGTFRTQVRTILEAAKKSGARVVVLGQNEWWRSPQGGGYGGTAKKRNAFDAVLMEETRAQGAELVDLRLLYRTQADQKLWAEDGIHPTASCYQAMAAELGRVIPLSPGPRK